MIKLAKKAFRKMFPEKSAMDFSGGYIPHRFLMERVKEGPVLVIGDFTGRDYPAIKKKFDEAYLLDIVDNGFADGKYFINQSVTDPLPFKDDFFKAISMTEVLEHVWEDKKVLEELRRVLHPEGKLLLSVPFFNDFHDRHFHIYSPKTIDLLLIHSGYEIIERNYRGLVVALPYWLAALLAVLTYPFWGKKSLEKVNGAFYCLHNSLSKYAGLNSFFRFKHIFKRAGVNMVAKKTDKKFVDDIEVQRVYFKL
jgi:SAM-dependent methyltransferase